MFHTNSSMGVFIGPGRIPPVTQAWGENVQNALLYMAKSKPRKYSLPPGYTVSRSRLVVTAILDAMSEIGLELGIRTSAERAGVASYFVRSTQEDSTLF